MLKVVLDTNILISAFLWDGNEAELFKEIEKNKVKLYTSFEIINEVENVIHREKFNELLIKAKISAEEIIEKIVSLSNLVIGKKLNLNICRDSKDNKFLECAKLAKADVIVSGDKDLLVLKEFNGIKILKTSQVLGILKNI